MKILGDLQLLDELYELPSAPVNSITLFNPAHQSVNIRLHGNPAETASPGLVVRREVFDSFLFGKVKEAGIDYMEDCLVRDVIRDGEQVTGVRASDRSNGIHVLKGRIIPGADGFNSVIAR